MKKLVFLLAAFLFLQTSYSQAVFCPQGAEWHFLNKSGADSFPFERSETVKYVRDTLVDGMSAKVLRHSLFFVQNSTPCKLTLIKQVGDTVFLRNQLTQHSWQVLYNFNVTAGQSWYNALLPDNYPGSAVVNFTTTVDSIRFVTVNGSSFKRLFVKNYADENDINAIFHFDIMERFGSNPFLFTWYIYSPFEINHFSELLCYEDANWPLQQFTNKPCNYTTINGINEWLVDSKYMKVSPNPVGDILNLEWDNFNEQELMEVVMIDATGKKVKRATIKQNEKIRVHDLSEGIYLLQLLSNNKLVSSTKIVKQ
jgi:hypothetical protein